MTIYLDVLKKLADGRFHSGQVLAADLGISRAAIWKHLRKIEAAGLAVDAVRGKGYCLQEPLELLDAEAIKRQLSKQAQKRLSGLELHPVISSTNRYLLETYPEKQYESGYVCIAESQTDGRGRRGRQWVSPFASNIYLSMVWRCADGPAALAGLSLALGVAIMRVLSDFGARDIGLKWPNDIIWQGKKLGGILVEIAGEANGPCVLVAGIGINVKMAYGAGTDIDQPWVDLRHILGDKIPFRMDLVCRTIEQMMDILHDYPQRGFSAYQQEWNKWDVVRGRQVRLSLPNSEKTGVVKGVDTEGALLLDTGKSVERITSGEISLRLQS